MTDIRKIVKNVSELNLKGFSEKETSEIMNISEVQVYRILSGSNSPIPRRPRLQAYKGKINKGRFP
jgi:orotate phosphoribosyltransferase-like protein